MAGKQCMTRLQKEYKSLLKDPVPHITAHPSPSNLLEWHFVLEGAKGTEYDGGVYHGKLVFPADYPFKPPSISLFTPNGRFATNTKLCLSMTDYHPESWNPMWSVGTILTGLLSFMYDTQATTGSITTSRAEKERLAAESLAFNAKNPTFRKLFPAWIEELTRRATAAAQPAPAQQAQAHAQAQQEQANGEVSGQANGHANGDVAAANGGGGIFGAARQGGGEQQNGQAGGRGGAPPGRGLGNSVVTLAVVVAVLAVVWVSSGSGGGGALWQSIFSQGAAAGGHAGPR
ncbi:hypothetical protein CHLRE_08g372400v5 [Chlamydomonas reinhardtii]|uniref:E2 ubiquitin-conjugating enzyme n=1 Tax=Chlamydomonas reinhardtii TaxID=3055 RepID=A0A2K3DHD3_CHLRE|nr:uncharacterized protein CHLRE_08g372400v5 [Chlamydomonas reinhardtii]PNW79926.1 hypothetical protein CHLRE_08g372400v5 [Chlamydomonas reinhardtii]